MSVLLSEHGTIGRYAIAGCCIGLAGASKWPGLVMMVPLLAAHAAGGHWGSTPLGRRGAWALGLSVASAGLFLVFAGTLTDEDWHASMRSSMRPERFSDGMVFVRSTFLSIGWALVVGGLTMPLFPAWCDRGDPGPVLRGGRQG